MDHFEFDDRLDAWEHIPSLPTDHINNVVGAAIDSHRMIVIESQDFIGCKSQTFLHDMRNCKWACLPHAPEPEVQAATSIDGNLIVLNKVKKCNDETETNQVHLFDVDDKVWKKLPLTIHIRDHCALVSHGRHVYAFGGFKYHHTPYMGIGYGLSRYPQNSAERLNIDEFIWEDLPQQNGDCALHQCVKTKY